jgi:D-tyrosyl-tRNA(Tyr) deacylase
MRLLIQRVSRASVSVDDAIVGEIDRGFLIFCGFRKGDRADGLARMAEKCLNLRVFEDDAGKMNLSLLDIKGELLVVSQFTLHANCRKGRRPSFDDSMPPDDAERYYDLLVGALQESGLKVETGRFGAKMKISLVNDGPVTILLDADEL